MVSRPVLIGLLLVVVALTGCVTQPPTTATSQYHEHTESAQPPKALNSLQKEALSLMNQKQFESAIGYLQRAIKIEPRNPMNWHLLAQNYWHLKQFNRCRDMIQRSRAYLQYQPDLQSANDILFEQCQ